MAVKKTKPSGPNVQFLEAIKALCFEREISEQDLFDAIEAALVVAYKKNFNQMGLNFFLFLENSLFFVLVILFNILLTFDTQLVYL